METAVAQKTRRGEGMNRIAIVDLMERWARYRQGRIDGGTGWPRQVTLGKIMDGMPGTDCPRCKDAVTGSSVGYIHVPGPGGIKQKTTCPICEGARKVKVDSSPNKANPALIHGSGPRMAFDDDPLSQRIDWLVCTALTEDQRAVVMAQYTQGGTQTMKARRLGISQGYFSELLGEAYKIIANNI